MIATMEIPFRQLTPETFKAVIEEYVTRQGTDYGATEISFDDKVAAVRHQIEHGRAKIVYDEEDETTNIITAI